MSSHPAVGDGVAVNARYCAPFLAALPVTGAAISSLGSFMAPETICASDDNAARLDELQFDLGEGPCWDASRTRRPVLTADLQTRPDHAWPALVDAMQGMPIRGLFAYPLLLGPLSVGVVDMYSSSALEFGEDHNHEAQLLAGRAARAVAREIFSRITADPEAPGEPASAYSRRHIHQATGTVLAQLNVSAADASLILRAHAFATGRSLSDVAQDVIEWKLDFALDLDESDRT